MCLLCVRHCTSLHFSFIPMPSYYKSINFSNKQTEGQRFLLCPRSHKLVSCRGRTSSDSKVHVPNSLPSRCTALAELGRALGLKNRFIFLCLSHSHASQNPLIVGSILRQRCPLCFEQSLQNGGVSIALD